MADNFDFTPGSGKTGAADDVGGVLYQRVKPTLGADGTAVDAVAGAGATDAGVQRVVLANDQTWGTKKYSANFTRPSNTTAYAANDAVNNNTSSGSVTPMQFTITQGCGVLRRVKVLKTNSSGLAATFRVWFYDASFTPGAGDNSAFAHPAANALGFVDVAVDTASSDGAVGYADCDIPFDVSGASSVLRAQIQVTTAYTPANGEVFTVDIMVLGG